MATHAGKQNWRYAQADARWRKKQAWPTTDPDERALIRCELRRAEVDLSLSKVWAFLYERGYDPRQPEESYATYPADWATIHQLMADQERLAKRSARLEAKTGKDAADLLREYRSCNVKSVCF